MDRLSVRRKLNIWIDHLFLLMLGVYLLFLMVQTTTFSLDLPDTPSSVFLYALCFLAILHLVFLLRDNPEFRSDMLRLILLSLVTALVWLMVYRNGGYPFLLYLAVFTVGCIGFDFHKILKLFVCVVGIGILTSTICALGGAIPNLVYLSSSRIRSSWGICYTTDFASYLLFLTITAWIAWEELPDLVFLIPGIVGLLISHFIAHSITSVFCFVLFLFFVLLHWLFHKGYLPLLKTIVDFCCCASFPCFGTLMIVLAWLFHEGNSFAVKVNSWNHGRLSLASSTYDAHGLTLFGTPFSQIGAGGSTFYNPDYNFVDCSYLLILLRYGLVTLLVVTLLWVLMTRTAIKAGRMALGMALIAVHSLSEHHFTELNYNIFLVLPFALFYQDMFLKKGDSENKPNTDTFSAVASRALVLTCSLALAVLALFGTTLLSWFRTICSIWKMDSGVNRQRALFIAVYVGFVFLILVVRSVYCVILSAFSQKKPSRLAMTIVVGGLCLAIIGTAGVTGLFRHEAEKQADELAADRNAIELIQSSGTGLYVDDLPAVYVQEFPAIRNGLYAGEDLVRLQDIALLTEIDWDSSVLSNRGFLYTPVSEKHAVYTNSQSAVSSLTDAGYHMTGYFPTVKSVDLEAMNLWNGLARTDDGGYYLDEDHMLWYGPAISLYSSPYTIRFDFRLPHESSFSKGDDPVIATIQITSRWGQSTVKEQPIRYSQFDDSRLLHLDVTTQIPTADGVEFKITPSENFSLVLLNITYQKTPTYDTHSVFDRNGRRIHASYYDLEGKPYYGNWGYQALDYSYDDEGNVVQEVYYDETGARVISNNGYSEIHCSYNMDKRIIREEYYDISGEPILLSNGYAAVDYEYDTAGNCNYYRYYGTDGAPIIIIWNFAELHRLFNEKKQIIREEYYDVDGSIMQMPAGHSAVEYGYDDAGNQNDIRYFDSYNQPCLIWNNYAGIHQNYNDKKQIVREEYFGLNREPILRYEGYFATEREYDDAGNTVIERFYDLENHLTLRSGGYAEVHRTFNDQKKVLTEEYYGTDGQLILLPSGYCSVVREYDNDGNLLSESFYDLAGNVVTPNA